jgi:hypothetical protein
LPDAFDAARCLMRSTRLGADLRGIVTWETSRVGAQTSAPPASWLARPPRAAGDNRRRRLHADESPLAVFGVGMVHLTQDGTSSGGTSAAARLARPTAPTGVTTLGSRVLTVSAIRHWETRSSARPLTDRCEPSPLGAIGVTSASPLF